MTTLSQQEPSTDRTPLRLPDRLSDPLRLRQVEESVAAAAVGDPEWARVARLARQVTGTRLAMVTVVSATDVVVAALDGRGDGLEPGSSEPAGLGTCGWVVGHAAVMAVTDLATDARTPHAGAARRLGLVSYLGVPLRIGEQVVGAVSVFDDHVRDWEPGHRDALVDLAALLGGRVAAAGPPRGARSLARVQAGLDSVLSHATVAVLEVDLDGVVRRTEGQGLLGGADLVGMRLDQLLGPSVAGRLSETRFDLDALGRSWRASAIPVRSGGAAGGWVVSLIDISDVRAAQAELERAYRTDPLTGLLNRAGLEREVAALVAASPDEPLRVTTLRLHGLGETNESLGHEVGDELLRVSAGRLRTLLPGRGEEVLARVDAGQFSLVGYAGRSVSPGWARAAARLLARPVRVRALSVVPQVSVGAATFDPRSGDGLPARAGVGPDLAEQAPAVVAELLRRAEVAVHAARRSGAIVREYDRGDDVAARRMVLASNLREALAAPRDGRGRLDLDGRLRLVYQPVVDLTDRRVASVEALLRWHDDSLGEVPPVEVVGVAEDAGLAVSLGEHVMARALHDTATWWHGGPDVPVMVNLSALQVCEPSLVGSTAALLARAGLPGRALAVEVTETAVLRDADMAATVLQQLRDRGVRVYLDDFGTGWSTLERMGDLPLDGIKLDRGFVQRLDRTTGRAAVSSAVALARALGVPLVVEGVETEAQAVAVAGTGADRAQGFLFSRPVAPTELVDLVRGAVVLPSSPAQRREEP